MKLNKKFIFGAIFSFLLIGVVFAYIGIQKTAAVSEQTTALEQPASAEQPEGLKINVLSWKNGVGLNQDIRILERELTQLGHHVHFIDVRDKTGQHPKADINIFVEVIHEPYFALAEKNYLVPNPEWTYFSVKDIASFDKVLCKTKEGERIFKPLNPNTVFMGFTCEDRYQGNVTKDYKKGLHLAGASIQKGTDLLVNTWLSNPQFPLLTVIKHQGNTAYPPGKNVLPLFAYLPQQLLIKMQNECGLHICPSETEGFGYYIMEGLSCGSVVVTTDAPPMNEFVTDKRCLVGYNRTAPWRLATNYYADPRKLEIVIENLLSLPEDELAAIGRKNREFYLENDRLFKERIAQIFKCGSKPKKAIKETSLAKQEKPQKTIVIMAYKDARVKQWDPDSIKSGIVGSEEAAIYISQKLARLGYKVLVLGNPPESSPHALPEANPRFVSDDFNDGTVYDIAIAWRLPWKAKELKERAKRVYLWPHDTCQGRFTEEQINGFDDVLWLSKWQRENWIEENPGFAKFTKIFGNGINPDQFKPLQERKNPYACIYGSNYARGLEILLDVWPEVKRQFPLASLDVYYGWQHWGLLSPEKEAKMRAQFVQLKPLDVHDNGLVSHEELNRAYEKASLWTYPCTAAETFCITALKAQLAGAVPVIIEGSALSETVRNGYKCSKSEEYLSTLTKAMKEIEGTTLEQRKGMGTFILKEFTWEALAGKWKELFDSNDAQVASNEENKSVFIAVLARNKAHVLDKFLKCIHNLDYNKKLITVYIKTDNNTDNTKEMLQEWVKKHGEEYQSIIFDSADTSDTQVTKPHEWSPTRFKVLATIRNNSMQKAKESKCDYYFVVDCDNFIASSTLKDLVKKDKPIIAPLLRSIPEPNDLYANFFYAALPNGYFKEHPDFLAILNRSKVGTFKVDLVHCTYLIKTEYIDKLNYIDGSNDYEFIIFARTARDNHVDQYICNEKEYGVQIHYYDSLSLEEEKNRIYPILTMP